VVVDFAGEGGNRSMRSLADREKERSRVMPLVEVPLGTLVLIPREGGAMIEIW